MVNLTEINNLNNISVIEIVQKVDFFKKWCRA